MNEGNRIILGMSCQAAFKLLNLFRSKISLIEAPGLSNL
jgi:hypothetical protein